ncbi:MAG TPA: hypothetical protein VKP78_11700 [bacterium]|nr:hypothetical protein [bacterium]
MKKIFTITLLLAIFMFSPLSGKSQCKHFAKQVCKKELAPYIHNGNYNAAILTEGENAEMIKTFYADQNYRIYICGSAGISKIRFQVMDINRNVIYDNKNDGYKTKWDFIPESSQQLIISLKVGNSHKEGENPVSGCVAIMVGVKE